MTNPKLPVSLILLALLSLAIAAQAQVTFFQPPTYTAGGTLFVGDFNGDGKPDLLGSNGVLDLGNGNGTFTAGQTVTGGALAVADFNGDGKLDVLQQGTGTLLVLLGNGDGTFQKPITTVIGASLTLVSAADLSGNGKADVLGIYNNNLLVYIGKGDGTFITPGASYAVPLLTGGSISAVILGDVNGDGKTDVTVITAGDNVAGQVVVFLGNGDGTFQTPPKTSTGITGYVSAVEGDFNGDGKVDLVISPCNGTCTGGISLLLGNGDGTFQAPTTVISATGLLATADFTGNGNLDLVVDNSSTLLQIYLGNGNGTFSSGAGYFQGAPLIPTGVAPVIADFNLDGKPDIAADGSVLLGNGNGTFQGISAVAIPQTLGAAVGITAVATGDFTNKGIQDVAAIEPCSTAANSPGCVYILLNDGTGALTLSSTTYTLQQPAEAIAAADLTGSGKIDLVVTGHDFTTQEWSYSVLLGNGDGTFQSPVFNLQSVTGNPSSFVIADFNNDHKPDLAIVLGSNTSQSLALLLGNGDGTFVSPPNYIFDASATSLAVADFKGNGNLDIAVGTTAGTGLLFGNGDGTFQAVVFPSNLSSFFVLATADFNNDGKPDLLGSGQVALGNGDGTFNVLPTFLPPGTLPLYGAGPPVADFNGDGNLDVSGSQTTGASTVGGLFLGNGDGTFAPFLPLYNIGTIHGFGTSIAAAADMNGDGRPDLILGAATAPPAVVVLLNTTAASFQISASALSPAPVTAGNSATSTVTVKPIFGFNGTVTLSCTGLPSGASCGFSPSSIANGSGTSSLTITTSSSTAAGTYSVKISGTSGSLVESTTVSLVVQAAPDFAIGAASGSPTSQTINAGQSAKFSLVITPSAGFTGTVNLSCAITPVVSPAPTCGLSSSSVQITGSGNQSVTVTVGTTAPVTTGSVSHVNFPSGSLPLAWTGILLSFAWLLLRNRKRLPIAAAPLMVLALALWVGCGGGGSSSQTTPGTPAGTYTAAVTATAGKLSHNMSLTITVQ